MRSRLLPALTAAVLAVALVPSAASAERQGRGPALPPQAAETAAERAETALARAQALFTEHSPAAAGGREATMVLNELVRLRDELSPADRQRADALLARPTLATGRDVGEYDRQEEPPVCGDDVCIHWVATGADRPPQGIDSVEQVLATAQSVHETFLQAGYLSPDPDGTRGGGTNLVDVYLADLGPGFYGYTAAEPNSTQAPYNRAAYIVIDNDFDGFGTPWLATMRVTLGHEYFHAVQFSYDTWEDPWFMEATATWVEDELFDDVDDSRQYLSSGQLGRPGIPLDAFTGDLNAYGNWIYFRYLTERWTDETSTLPVIVREMWELASGRLGAPDMYSTQAIERVLRRRDTSFAEVYGQFVAANRHPARSYEEGESYPKAGQRSFTLGSGNRKTGARGARLDHLTHQTFRFNPGDGVRRLDWRIKVQVDMPIRRTVPVARLVIQEQDGGVRHRAVRLSRSGNGRAVVGFSSQRVELVELVLANASRRTDCRSKTREFAVYYACSGIPRDDDKRTDFSASIFRR
jgi:hypothetical protein